MRRSGLVVLLVGSSACAGVLEEREENDAQEPQPATLVAMAPVEPAAIEPLPTTPDPFSDVGVYQEGDAAREELEALASGQFVRPRYEPSAKERRRIDRACKEGRRDAQRLLARGHFGLPTMGLPAPCRPELARRLLAELDIRLFAVTGCVVSERERAYERCYEEVMTPAIARKHGPDAVSALADEVCGP